jgi:CheY-like chemotaxis protein
MRTILVADDEGAIRLLLRVTLGTDQYEILEACDGDEAWSLIQQHRPVVALLDVAMPGKTGLDLARAIKANPETAGTRVIMLTSKSQQADVEAGLAAGADFYLTKPFSPHELLQAIES